MSFAGQVKEELCRVDPGRKCCARAELYGALLFCHSFTGREVRIVTGNPSFAKRLPELLKRGFRLSFDQISGDGKGKRTLTLTAPDKLAALLDFYGYDPALTLAHHINFAVLEEDHCRCAFLRGAFLAGGSVSDPEKSYHLELVSSHYNVSRELCALLQEVGFSPKQTTRKSNYVTYFKPSETIEEFLTLLGAPLAAMDVMNAKLEKNLRGSVNRRVNCDSANLDKAVDAALEQVEAIRRYAETHGLDSLPDKLQETARLRWENPELTLTQLAALFDPPITKSALNHRLRKLMELARG